MRKHNRPNQLVMCGELARVFWLSGCLFIQMVSGCPVSVELISQLTPQVHSEESTAQHTIRPEFLFIGEISVTFVLFLQLSLTF
jgi:hypothetical protein